IRDEADSCECCPLRIAVALRSFQDVTLTSSRLHKTWSESLQLAPQFLQVDLEGIRQSVVPLAPHAVVDARSRQHFARMTQEADQQRQLLGRQVERLAGALGTLRCQIDGDIAIAQCGSQRSSRSPEQRANACQQ